MLTGQFWTRLDIYERIRPLVQVGHTIRRLPTSGSALGAGPVSARRFGLMIPKSVSLPITYKFWHIGANPPVGWRGGSLGGRN